MDLPATSHLVDFLAVIDNGGLSAGARNLGRAQAAVSYSIQSLERDLGIILFDRAARPLVPTEEGLALAIVARDVIQNISRLQTKATNLREGIESQINLIVDTLMPMTSLIPFIEAFAEQFPAVDLEIIVDAMTSPMTAVLNGTCALGISGPMALRNREIVAVPLVSITRIAVAAPSHPLAKIEGEITHDLARTNRQIIMLDRDRASVSQVGNAVSELSWRTSDIGAKREMLLAGLGWGNMPEHVVKDDLASGRLHKLSISRDLAARWETPLQFYLIRSDKHPPGLAASWLFERASKLFSTMAP